MPARRQRGDVPDVRKQNRVRIFSLQARYQADLAGLVQQAESKCEGFPGRQRKEDSTTGPGLASVYVSRGRAHARRDTGQRLATKDHPEIETTGRGAGWLYDHFVRQLQQWAVPSHDGSGEVGVRKIGISYATIASCPPPYRVKDDPLGRIVGQSGSRGSSGSTWGGRSGGGKPGLGGMGLGGGRRRNKRGGEESGGGLGLGDGFKEGDLKGLDAVPEVDLNTPKLIDLEVNPFVVEFIWRPDPPRPVPPVAPATPVAAAPGASKSAAPATSPAPKK